MTLAQGIQSLIIILQEAQEDANKLESGTRGANPAGARLRKKAQIVGRELLKLRKTVLVIRKAQKEENKKAAS